MHPEDTSRYERRSNSCFPRSLLSDCSTTYGMHRARSALTATSRPIQPRHPQGGIEEVASGRKSETFSILAWGLCFRSSAPYTSSIFTSPNLEQGLSLLTSPDRPTITLGQRAIRRFK